MNREINKKLLLYLPIDVIINNILPYTYLPQPAKLMRDIRSFYSDYSFLENAYTYNYNYNVLLYDLLCFFNRSITPYNVMNQRFSLLLSRMFKMRNLSFTEINEYIIISFYREITINIVRKIRFLWGVLRTSERTLFINKYVLEYEYI
jgi:hypothetical protein